MRLMAALCHGGEVWAVLWDNRGRTISHNQGQEMFSWSEQRC